MKDFEDDFLSFLILMLASWICYQNNFAAVQELQLRFQQRQTGTPRSEFHCRLSVPLFR